MKLLQRVRNLFGRKSSNLPMSPRDIEILQRENQESQRDALPSANTSMRASRFTLLRAQAQPATRLGMETFLIERVAEQETSIEKAD